MTCRVDWCSATHPRASSYASKYHARVSRILFLRHRELCSSLLSSPSPGHLAENLADIQRQQHNLCVSLKCFDLYSLVSSGCVVDISGNYSYRNNYCLCSDHFVNCSYIMRMLKMCQPRMVMTTKGWWRAVTQKS